MKFRKDVNGLRAIAVIAVVLFHFNSSWMPGGFAGVDVFFVISGFLMTGIIFKGIERESFSILDFYVARANRIIPALAALCLVLLIFGWFSLSPFDYKKLGMNVASSMGFLSNVFYWIDSGYFDEASQEKWLLHTWSLSVEWQFYIIYPLVLVVMRKFMSLNAMKVTVLLGTVLGFILCVIATYKWHTPAYFLLPTRAWEMMIGGVAFLYPFKLQEKNKRYIEWLGLALIICSYALISKSSPWPGYLAIFPVLGSFLILQSQRNDSYVTSNVVFQKIGAWSYSIYLWHWPLVVAIYYYSLNDEFIYFGIALSVLLGFLSNKYIEKIRFRNNFGSLLDYLNCKPVYMAICLGVISGFVIMSDGIVARFSDDIQMKNKSAIAAVGDRIYPDPNLKVGSNLVRFIKGSSDKNILFIGASHIEQTYPYVESFGSEYNVYYLTRGGCFISPSYINPKWSCLNIQRYEDIINEIKFDKIVTSIYVLDKHLSDDNKIRISQIKTRISEYDEFLRFAKSNSDEVFMILGEPKGLVFDPKLSVRHNLKNSITLEEARQPYVMHYDSLEKLDDINDVVIIDPMNHLCGELCFVMDEDFNYFYSDPSHMRPWYAIKSLTYLDQILK
jgi:peptidoglycan/LPS O-acetylase OafA/YrhL